MLRPSNALRIAEWGAISVKMQEPESICHVDSILLAFVKHSCVLATTLLLLASKKKLEAAREEQQTEEAGCSVVRPVAGLRTPTRRGDKVPLVIFFNGTFGPVHQGHLNTLFDARRLLEAKVTIHT